MYRNRNILKAPFPPNMRKCLEGVYLTIKRYQSTDKPETKAQEHPSHSYFPKNRSPNKFCELGGASKANRLVNWVPPNLRTESEKFRGSCSSIKCPQIFFLSDTQVANIWQKLWSQWSVIKCEQIPSLCRYNSLW